jgi:F0F1-type ATP synthase assembly protein I
LEASHQMSKSPDNGGIGRDMGRGFAEASQGLSLALGFVLPVIVLWLGGRALDGWLGTHPWAQVVGSLLGWVLGFAYVYYGSRRMSGGSQGNVRGPQRGAGR